MGKWTLLTMPEVPLTKGNGVAERPQRGRSPGLSQILSIQDLWQIRKALQRPRPSTAGQADPNPTVKCRQRLRLLLASRKEASLCDYACQTLSELLMSHESFPAMLGILNVCEGCVCAGWTDRLPLALTCLPS